MTSRQILLDEEIVTELVMPLRRLCSEIQLFDLCDLEQCRYKRERFCTDEKLLIRFERIADSDICTLLHVAEVFDGEDGDRDDMIHSDEMSEEGCTEADGTGWNEQ